MKNEILGISKKEKKIIGIRLYGEEDDFWLGYIEDYNDKIIQLRYFDKLGLEDGLVIEQQDNIDSIDFDSEYEKTYEYLINKRNDLHKIEKIVEFKNTDDWRKKYLTDFKNNGDLISIEFNKELQIYGYICNLSESEFIINGITHLGEDEGKTVYKIDDITAFRLGDKKSKLRQELNKWRINK
jgi:hypothetical protein